MRRRYPTTPSTGSATSLSVRTPRPSAPAQDRKSWPPYATPRSTSADSPGTPKSLPPNATTAGHQAPPSTRSPQRDQQESPQVNAIPDLAMPLGLPGFVRWSTGVAGRSRVSEPKLQDKPFRIDKMVVWEAFGRVKANKGGAGVDEQ